MSDGNVDDDKHAAMDLKALAKRSFHVAETTGCLTLSRLHLEQLPPSVQNLPWLVELDLSHNNMSRFPGESVAQCLTRLRVVNLEHNHLHCIEDVLALSRLPQLESLNVHHNPMPLVQNRIYFLEARHLLCITTSSMWRMCFFVGSVQSETATEIERTRSCESCGFPMLQRLNGTDISHDDIATVEREMGRKLRYDAAPPVAFEGDTGSAKKGKATRKTVKELHYKQSKSATFPAPTKVPLLRYAIDGNTVPEPLYVDDDSDAADLLRVLGDRVETEEMERLRRELRLGLVLHDGGGADATVPPTASDVAVWEGATWNTTIQSFDSLANDQRCWVREKSKVATDASLKDNPFEANVVLGNMIQAERSRRLTQRAVDVLTAPAWLSHPNGCGRGIPTAGAPSTGCSAGDQLIERLNAQHTRRIVERNYKLTEAFCKQTFQVGSVALAPDIRDVIEADHKHMQVANTKLMSKVAVKCDLPLVDSIDLTLSRVRNDNAVESVVKSLNSKHEKRLVQALIDSDQQVVEEEVRRQRIQEHKDRMDVIACRARRPKSATSARKVSAWQKRNVHALAARSKPSKDSVARELTGNVERQQLGARRRILPYQTIERVEDARLDTLPRVTTKELLVRCADIRMQSKESLMDLARAKNEFVEAEIQWELHRRDPIELLRRKVQATACEGNEVMIGNQEFIYSAF
ncbi:hypothetical protein H310_01934 [Aphanomyces invadans]|uniref:U2A'/phosphoprotein 32 family A C-terminal domain-containing protein n=1 Tax=Aphanomyces invadans TaxID=157072 RepID=A0A024ULW9_9STRA|nr:hypothetical protein H310_01934 [Aphanomyces invadans]ETW07411.1 hypothetical protein H310_01934 [Aphanomyces invadans]|eukprot:XP_008863504.1 hypothetical protein H310_01934 [Aphanomyces invadans]